MRERKIFWFCATSPCHLFLRFLLHVVAVSIVPYGLFAELLQMKPTNMLLKVLSAVIYNSAKCHETSAENAWDGVQEGEVMTSSFRGCQQNPMCLCFYLKRTFVSPIHLQLYCSCEFSTILCSHNGLKIMSDLTSQEETLPDSSTLRLKMRLKTSDR